MYHAYARQKDQNQNVNKKSMLKCKSDRTFKAKGARKNYESVKTAEIHKSYTQASVILCEIPVKFAHVKKNFY